MNETSPFNPSIPVYLREVADALLEAFQFYEDPYLNSDSDEITYEDVHVNDRGSALLLLLRSGIAQQLSDFKDYEERARWDVEALRQICLYLSGNQGVSAATYWCFPVSSPAYKYLYELGPTSHPAHISRDDIVSALAKKERHLAAVIAARDALRKALSDRTVLHEVEGSACS